MYILPFSSTSCKLSTHWTIKSNCSRTCSLHRDSFAFLASSGLYSYSHHKSCDSWTGLPNFLWRFVTPSIWNCLHLVLCGSMVFCNKSCFYCFSLSASLIETTDKGMLCYFMLYFRHHQLILCAHIICRVCVLVSVSAVTVLLNLLIFYFLYFGP